MRINQCFEKTMAEKRYTAAALKNAVAEMQSGEATSMRAVARKYAIPVTTLHDHHKQKSKKIGAGGPTVLTASEEHEIVLVCIALGDMGFGLTRELISKVIQDYIHDKGIKTPFKDGVVNVFPNSWVSSTLETKATRFLKEWIGLAKPVDPSRLYLGGLGLPAISTISGHQWQVCSSPHPTQLSQTGYKERGESL